MKRINGFGFLFFVVALCVPQYVTAQSYSAPIGEFFRQEGIGSWYGPGFEGRPTASGEIFDSSQFTAAHPNLPFGTFLLITNRHNNRQVTVRVNDRGPFVASRIIDVSQAAAEHLDMIITGTAPVIIETLQASYVPSPQPQAQIIPEVQIYTQAQPQAVQPQPQYVQVQPQQVQPQPQYVQTEPQYVQAQPQYVQPQPQYVQAEPQYIPQPQYVQAQPQQPQPQQYVQAPQPVQVQPQYVQPQPQVVQQQPQPPQQQPPVVVVVEPTPPLAITHTFAEPVNQVPVPVQQPEVIIAAQPQPIITNVQPLPPPQPRASGVKFIPAIEPLPGKVYKLQVGSFKDPRSAVAAFERLRDAGLGPSYERYGDFYRVVLAGVRGTEVQSVANKLDNAGFHEAIIREE